ncbi:hypothetical protein A2634_00800 [Candidatus Amesbacteria bacterium RIFCSPHIGHO2_01_FULL_48_32]|uniref:Purple acid phosphatase N-terminal domain-containing protein n=1 Tax=Candidatus Amesbacteria bacterium RIFCSPLOWO2_01_FULL_48_25 TaxID=1797259 RepID=A0A1F4ZD38_9BACT|nr:MAG: hypothetical protein A2634_00800 [Candidatus Amesbacteria bacterium RIFCSPHIGHO2_01_FULL_48_32]OGD03344.1 MAG: hypothetical protein A2989_00750 [Candidatus Amesbacteria bacterium RIFCSPLOWO2_01_FULL_48_25]HJZ05298.1 fibronectin type III domain-containing protein [Patescibacteria group bacterium]
MKREFRLPTLVGLLVATAGLVSGLVLLREPIGQRLQASAEETPREVKVTNISDVGFVVSWITDKAVAGYVQYGEGEAGGQLAGSDERDQEKGSVGNYFTHFVSVKGLKPDTVYGFKLGSGRSTYDQAGKLYRVTTGPVLADTPEADVAYGQVNTGNGDPAEGSIVYLQIGTNVPQATLVKANGSFVIPISTMRTATLAQFSTYEKQNQEEELFVQGGALGTAAVTTTTGNDEPVPNITLGKIYDYRGVTTEEEATASAQTSKFTAVSLGPVTEVMEEGSILILSPQEEEKINSPRPQIIGRGPAGAKLTVEIRSQHIITQNVTVDGNGDFSVSVPKDIEPGEHTISISAVINGVVKKVTRTFTVYAIGESNLPAFSATPSATLVPTARPSPTSTPTPTIKPSPTLKPSPTPTTVPGTTVTPTLRPTATPTLGPTIAPSPTPMPVIPPTGNDLPTWIVVIAGMLLVIGGTHLYRKAG